MRTEAQKAARKRYEQSDKGKIAKRKHEAAYVESGGRANSERLRSEQPVSEARKAARKRWASEHQAYFTAMRSKRRNLEKSLSQNDFWIYEEAVLLSRLREKLLGGKWHVDHIIPVSKGGTSTPDNLQVVPAFWNRKKSNKHTERFFAHA